MFPGFEGFRRFFGLYGFGGLEVYFYCLGGLGMVLGLQGG